MPVPQGISNDPVKSEYEALQPGKATEAEFLTDLLMSTGLLPSFAPKSGDFDLVNFRCLIR